MKINLKKTMIQIFLLVLFLAAFSYAKGAVEVNSINFSEVQLRIWNLEEVKSGSTVIRIDRTNVRKDIYTLIFESDRLIGAGADNLYSAPFTLNEDNVLSIGRLKTTRVAPLYEMDKFTEYEYFQHLARVDRWDFRDEKLELRTYDEKGALVILIFT